MNKNKRLNIKNTVYEHVVNNSKEYILVTLIFLIGIFLGVMFINNTQEAQMSEITSYMNNFIDKLKNIEELENIKILKSSLIENIILAITLWFFGTTVIGIPIVFGIILYRGFCLGYTIASIIAIMGIGKGIGFIFMALLLQNIIFIPAIVAIGVSGFKLYKSIVKDRNRDNIKIEVVRHTIFSAIMLLILCIASAIEILISTNILKNFIKYF
ncbi:MAG: stage II sporulation protein M [Clostridia bacterium]|nr:stage II sporulation protein M [Clostridia bacterium]